jgi:hypothetical protein
LVDNAAQKQLFLGPCRVTRLSINLLISPNCIKDAVGASAGEESRLRNQRRRVERSVTRSGSLRAVLRFPWTCAARNTVAGHGCGRPGFNGYKSGENGKAGEGQMAGPTNASANFDPIVSLVMSLLGPPAVRGNRIAQTSRTTARHRFLAGGSPVQIWVARITAKWDKNNRTAWEALSLNRLLSGSFHKRSSTSPRN